MSDKSEIFLSFSGDKSLKVAEEFGKLIKHLKLGESFLSKDKVTVGDDWLEKISSALDSSKIGLIFITESNKNSPWIYIEYGVFLYKKYKHKKNQEITKRKKKKRILN
jgi:hypothetical protein